MSIVVILEIAIGMIFAWLVMSLAGMYIQELIVSVLGWRSSMLEQTIGNMMADPSLARQFYDHPLIRALHSGEDGKKRPAYIPPAQFSLALLDIIRNAPKEAALIQKTLYDLQIDIRKLSKDKQADAQKQLDLALSITHKAVASEGGPEVASAMLEDVKKILRKLSTENPSLQRTIEAKFTTYAAQKKQIDAVLASLPVANPPASPGDPSINQLRAGLAVMSITHPDLKQAIEALIDEIGVLGEKAENALLLMRKNIEEWFNGTMDRLSGWYKRRAQAMALLIGLSIAVLLNIDSIQLTTQLWRDPSVRQAMAAEAEATVNQNPNGFPTTDAGQLLALNMQISQLNIPVGWIGTGLPADANGAVAMGDGSQRLCTFMPKSGIDIYGILLGNQCYPVINTPQLNDPAGWLMKLVGLLITTMAAAQGAPFWFDILKNVVNVRSAGTSPSTSG